MNPKPDKIYLVGLGRVAKVRPAVVVSRDDPDSPRALSIFVPLTTENRGSDYEVSLGNPRFLNNDSWANHRGERCAEAVFRIARGRGARWFKNS